MNAKRERVGQFAGIGCLIQGLGLLAPFVLAALASIIAGAVGGVVGALVGVVVLVVLLIVGSAKAKSWRCGNCKNPIASASVTICPVCKAVLE
jgi:hypothetical protein